MGYVYVYKLEMFLIGRRHYDSDEDYDDRRGKRRRRHSDSDADSPPDG
jgi:hypothetical protein